MAKRRESAAAERRRERWRQTLRRWRAGGLSQAEFCRRRGIPVSKLSWWKRRLRSEAIGPPRKFMPLGVLQGPSRARRLEVVLTNGRRGGVRGRTLERTIVRAMGTTRCRVVDWLLPRVRKDVLSLRIRPAGPASPRG